MLPILQRDTDLIRLAREIAIDHYDIEDVLDRYQLSYDAWGWLCVYPRFATLLANEEEAWKSAKNTKERVRLKSAAVIEAYLESAATSLLDSKETLVAKTGLAKLVASFAGIGTEADHKHAAGGSGFSITINLGDRTVQVGTGRGLRLGEDEDDEDEMPDGEDLVEGALEIEEFGAISPVFELENLPDVNETATDLASDLS